MRKSFGTSSHLRLFCAVALLCAALSPWAAPIHTHVSAWHSENLSADSLGAFETKADKMLKLIYETAKQNGSAMQSDSQQAQEKTERLKHLSEFVGFHLAPDGKINLSVGVELKSENADELKRAGFAVGALMGNVATVETNLDRLLQLAALSSVSGISAATYYSLTNDRAAQGIGATSTGGMRAVTQTGRGVVVGILDTGIDFRHPDFTRPGSNGQQTRIKALLDMTVYNPVTINVNGSNVTIDADWNYYLAGGNIPVGRLYTESDINAALQAPKPADQNNDLVKQRDKNSHGTHVAGTAAGNGLGAPSAQGLYAGIAPEADLIIVKGNRSDTGEYLFQSTDQINALAFIKERATVLGEPFVINMSYGDHFGPHEGTHILDQAIDNLAGSGPGRAVCVAAGNSGNENIHASGDVTTGGDVVLNIVPPPGDNPAFLELYYAGADRISVTVTKPNGATIGPIAYNPNGYVNGTPADPHISVYNTTDTHYGKNNLYVNFTNAARNLGALPWSFRLHGDAVTAGGHFNAWIWRGNFTSFADSAGHLTSPGVARGAITAGAWTTRGNPSAIGNYALFTSTGPTVDGRQKPDISAPGDFLYSSRSSDNLQTTFFYGSGSDALATGVSAARYGGLAGTSMSTPVVTGAVALLLQADPNLTVEQIKELLKNNATHDSFTGQGWSPRFGNGKLNIAAAINAAPTNLLDDAQFFVAQHYRDFLGREPDPDGLAYWTGQITQCGTDQNCINSRRIGVSAAYFIETEFQETGSFVYRFHKATYGQRPNYAQFSSDRSSVVGGADLETNKQAFADAWVQRPEFLTKYPAQLSGTQFIDSLLQTVQQGSGVNLSNARQALIDDYAAHQSRARVLRMVADEQAFKEAEYNKAFVLMQYFGYLRRDPDEGGYLFWLDVLNNRVPDNYRGMVCAFINSAEYQLRFGPAVTRNDQVCGSV